MGDQLEVGEFYELMTEASKNVGYLSGESCKVLLALALRPESRENMLALKQVTCIEDNTELVQAISDLVNMNLVKYDGKGGIAVNEGFFAQRK